MPVWKHSCSWSKFKLALDCPKELEYTLSGEIRSDFRPDYHSVMGKTVQFVFEKFFMTGLNKDPRARNINVMNKIVDRVFTSPWFQGQRVSYSPGQSEQSMKEQVIQQVENGFNQFLELGLLDKAVQSEQKWNATFQNFRMFGQMDFVYEPKYGVVELYDGKGHAKKNADPRQILYYALILHASNKKIRRAGFMYWQHDFEEIDVSPAALKDFVDGDFARGKAVMQKLIVGATDLPANPSSKNCYFCNWRSRCPDSFIKTEPPNFGQSDTVTFSS